mgnify:CR=1 FL=1
MTLFRAISFLMAMLVLGIGVLCGFALPKAPGSAHPGTTTVGEAVEAISIIKSWLERHPDEEFVFSCGTSTGFATAVAKLPAKVVSIYCPLDCWWMVRHAYALIRPRLVAILEVEIWPNLILQASKWDAEIHRQTTPADDMHRIEGQVHQHQKGKQDVVEKHHGSRKF